MQVIILQEDMRGNDLNKLKKEKWLVRQICMQCILHCLAHLNIIGKLFFITLVGGFSTADSCHLEMLLYGHPLRLPLRDSSLQLILMETGDE